jgi:hypothetical protein
MAGSQGDSFQRLHGESFIMFYEGEYRKGADLPAQVRDFALRSDFGGFQRSFMDFDD